MDSKLFIRRAAAVLLIAALFAPFFVGPVPVRAQDAPKIVFDYSHGQYASKLENTTDLQLENNLTDLGYEVVWAWGGINSSILSDADGLVLGSVYGESNVYLASEVTAIADWFNAGGKFLWVGFDSDYGGNQYHHDTNIEILEAVGSHVYGEPTSVEDPISNTEAAYRVVANGTSDDPFVADIVAGVDKVLMHGPTLVYGSNSDTPGENVEPVALETTTIPNVYPLIYYGAAAEIKDADTRYPYAHEDGQQGAFVAATLEVNAGDAGDGVIVVSGASAYGDYQPMCSWVYYDIALSGDHLVEQAIDFGMTYQPPADMTLLLVGGGIGAVVIIILIVVLVRRK
ncbi:hypothetical protein EU538_02130 [Candidatus Thorarchaeota archaeon]|nr:MAG: hypothetical protein EU538_02130 [Candidatus Thorarchaeota archaeon]